MGKDDEDVFTSFDPSCRIHERFLDIGGGSCRDFHGALAKEPVQMWEPVHDQGCR